jgi:hypothetical protein
MEGESLFLEYLGRQTELWHSVAMSTSPKIVAAAIKDKDGKVYSVPQPGRHCDVFLTMPRDQRLLEAVQGFIDETGAFLDRHQAYKVAKENFQILPAEYYEANNIAPTPGTLYSEDLW